MVLRFAPDAVRPHLAFTEQVRIRREDLNQLPEEVTAPLDYLRRNAGLRDIAPIRSTRRRELRESGVPRRYQHRLAAAASVIDAQVPGLAGIALASLPPKNVTADVVKHVSAARAIEFCERMPARWLTAGPAPDPDRNLQWGLRAIGWFGAAFPDASDIRVGVVDSGIDTTHPALRPLDIDYHHAGTTKPDVVGHGTHVGGTIAAAPDDRAGIAGLARPSLTVWKVLPDEPQHAGNFYIDAEAYIEALGAAAQAGLAVVNLSLAGTKPSDAFEPTVIRALQDAGVTVVAATGNGYEKGDPTMYPAVYEGVLAVGSIAEDGQRSAFSGTGPYIDLVAPGSNVLSTCPLRRSKYREKRRRSVESGTSMATAHASAAIAMLAAKHPDWSSEDRCEHLRKKARKLPAMRRRNWSPAYGAGLLDVRAALS